MVVFAGGALGMVRLLPSTVLGVVLGVVCWQTRSVWPGIVLHVIHNVLLVAFAQTGILKQDEVPILWIAGSVAATLVGLGVIVMGSRRKGELTISN